MAGLINLVMVDIYDIHALYQSAALSTLHLDDILVLQRHACRIRFLQDSVPVLRICRLAVRQNAHDAIRFQLRRQFLMRQKRRHAKLRHSREDSFTG